MINPITGNASPSTLKKIPTGIRFRFGGVLVLRFDFGRRFTLTDANRFYDLTNVDVQRGWFKQFFFGWDF